MAGALEDVRVLDLSSVLAGPFATTILADFGAKLIKVEPPGGDYTWNLVQSRALEIRRLSYWNRRRNRKSITLNLTKKKGKDIFLELVKASDVVIQNFRRPVMDNLGLGYDVMRETNPRIIYCAISGYGQTGPYRDKMAYDPVIQAATGVMSMNGFPDKPPLRVAIMIGDYSIAVYAVTGILLALHYRDVTGKGQMVDASMFDALCHWTVNEIGGYQAAGGKRMGSRSIVAAPLDVYWTSDNKPFLMGVQTDKQWHSFLKMIGREDLIDENWTYDMRLRRRDEIEPLAQDWVNKKTLEEAEKLCEEADIVSHRIVDLLDLPEDPQILVREMLLEVEDPECGSLRGVFGTVPKLSETPGSIGAPPPAPGQHNEEVLCDMLGYSREDLSKLKEEGVI